MFKTPFQPTPFFATLAAAAALAAAGPAAADPTLSSQDATFVKMAAQGGMAEVADATVVAGKTNDPAVKAFAERMIHDHGKANDQLASIAKSQSITLPSDIGPTNADMKDKLQALDGKALDTAYLTGQKTAHEQTIALFQKEVQSGSDPQLVAFAKQTLPTIESHLHMDEKDISSMSNSPGAGGM
jgi:putative membrane protein